jgi:hypothetical protein
VLDSAGARASSDFLHSTYLPRYVVHCSTARPAAQKGAGLHCSNELQGRFVASGRTWGTQVKPPMTHGRCARQTLVTRNMAVIVWRRREQRKKKSQTETPGDLPQGSSIVTLLVPPLDLVHPSLPEYHPRCLCRRVTTRSLASPHEHAVIPTIADLLLASHRPQHPAASVPVQHRVG